MKKLGLRRKWVILSVVVIPLLVSCDFLIGLTKSQDKGRIVVSLSSDMHGRTISPPTDLIVVAYDIDGSGPSGNSFHYENASGSLFTREDVAVGTWSITARGKNAAGGEITRGTVSLSVSPGTTATATLLCTPISGAGTLQLSLSWPAGTLPSPYAEATVTSSAGAVRNITFSIAGTTASWSADDLQNGYYTLGVKLRTSGAGSSVAWSRTETVLILSGSVTTGSWALAESDLDLPEEGVIGVTIQ